VSAATAPSVEIGRHRPDRGRDSRGARATATRRGRSASIDAPASVDTSGTAVASCWSCSPPCLASIEVGRSAVPHRRPLAMPSLSPQYGTRLNAPHAPGRPCEPGRRAYAQRPSLVCMGSHEPPPSIPRPHLQGTPVFQAGSDHFGSASNPTALRYGAHLSTARGRAFNTPGFVRRCGARPCAGRSACVDLTTVHEKRFAVLRNVSTVKIRAS
jgi:hypothetical protein